MNQRRWVVALASGGVTSPATVQEYKTHHAELSSFNDAAIGASLDAATSFLQQATRRFFVNTSVDFVTYQPLDAGKLYFLPHRDTHTISAIVADGVAVTPAYTLDSIGGAVIFGQSISGNIIRISGVAGYGADGDAVPDAIKQAVILYAGALLTSPEHVRDGDSNYHLLEVRRRVVEMVQPFKILDGLAYT